MHFTNFEIFASILKGYDLDLKQIDRGTFSGTLQQIECNPVFINRITSTRRFEISGNPPPGLRTFGIPTANCLPFTWRGKYSAGNTIQIYKPDTELEMITHPFFEAIDVSITENAFNELNQQWGFPELNKLIDSREMVICNPEIMQQLRITLQTICTTIDSKPDLLKQSTDLQDLIRYEVPYLLVQALITAETQEINTMPAKRNHALKTAVDYIQATPPNKISLNQFCSDNDINERTLQRAFIEQYGISPRSYAKAHQLNSIYKTLLHSDSRTIRISDIASSFGFWHMSQFATDYRRHFGELPSETLNNHP
ncbi:MAG: helix-turn-helix domain-containing protein [Thiotrichaceae bacterium]|nr:helix-turn-helix domain-containing protein [Thiotrichaceae bacterium]